MILEPIAIRVYLNKEAFGLNKICSPEILSCESAVAAILKTCPYTVEPSIDQQKKRRPPWDLVNKTVKIETSAEITPGLFWSFQSPMGLYTHSEAPATMVMRPTILAASASDTYQHSVLHQVQALLNSLLPRRRAQGPNAAVATADNGRLMMSSSVLVVTQRPDPWMQAGETMALLSGLLGTRGALPNKDLVVASPQSIADNLLSEERLFAAVHAMGEEVLQFSLSEAQTRRYAVQLAKMYPNFVLPVDLLQFGCIILDDMEALQNVLDLISPSAALHCVQIFKDSWNTKPTGLNTGQIRVLQKHSLSNVPTSLLGPHLGNLVQIIPVSKSVLRKFKVYPHLVKNGPVEERLTKTFAAKYCPLPNAEAMQRFSGKPVPLSVARDLIVKHFSRLQVSLATFLTPPAEQPPVLPLKFVLDTLEPPDVKTVRTCCICFEELVPQTFNVSICGHVYCRDCSRMHFNDSWNNSAAKECANCRTPLLLGDFFFIEDFSKSAPFVPAQASKDSAVAAFMSSLRSMAGVVMWDQVGSQCVEAKRLIITDVQKVQAIDILRGVCLGTHNVSIHVFFTGPEQKAYDRFEASF